MIIDVDLEQMEMTVIADVIRWPIFEVDAGGVITPTDRTRDEYVLEVIDLIEFAMEKGGPHALAELLELRHLQQRYEDLCEEIAEHLYRFNACDRTEEQQNEAEL